MKTIILLTLLQLGTAANDAYWTNHNLHSGFAGRHESNPFARPFVGSTKGCVIYFSLTTAGHLALAHELRHRHHNKLSTLTAVEGILDNGISGGISAAHSSPSRR